MKVAIALIGSVWAAAHAYAFLEYPVVDTGVTACYGNSSGITPPAEGQPFYGQDAQYTGNEPSYVVSGDGLTVSDVVTGIIWQFCQSVI